jgi:hypothetical protein
MTERSVDVKDKAGKVLHTYPINIGAPGASPIAADFEKAALAAAATAKLVPQADLAHLTAHMRSEAPVKK